MIVSTEKVNIESKMVSFEKEIEDYNRQNYSDKLYLQMAVYNPETDTEYMDVFRRADYAMYEDKKQKKDTEFPYPFFKAITYTCAF